MYMLNCSTILSIPESHLNGHHLDKVVICHCISRIRINNIEEKEVRIRVKGQITFHNPIENL